MVCEGSVEASERSVNGQWWSVMACEWSMVACEWSVNGQWVVSGWSVMVS